VFQVFLLSPAQCNGVRGRLVRTGEFEVARRLRSPEGIPLGELFSFVSGLYFRGKLGYARAFARPPAGSPGSLIITPGDGLRPPEDLVSLDRMRGFADVPIDGAEPRYRDPLLRDARRLADGLGVGRADAVPCRVVLLGSVATGKYVDLLSDVFGSRLCFPSAFVGRGDMSRGGLMLRCVRDGAELEYVAVEGAVRHGPRPARLAQPRS